MKKYLQTKKEKIWATVSLIWLVLSYAIFMAGRRPDTESFFIFGLMPVVIGWGVYIIWYDDIKNKKFNLFNLKKIKTSKQSKDNEKYKPMSKWAEWGTIILAIIFGRLFGLLGVAAVAAGYGVYYLLDKEYNKAISITAGVIAGIASYLLIIAVILS